MLTIKEQPDRVAIILGDEKNQYLYLNKDIKRAVIPQAVGSGEDRFGGRDVSLIGEMSLFPLPADAGMLKNNIYIAAQTGAGKSFFCAQWLRYYREIYPDRPIYLFSRVAADENYDKIPGGVIRIAIDNSLIENPIDIKAELKRSVVVFDDIDSATYSKPLKEALHKLQIDVLCNGRDQANLGDDVSCLITQHQITNYARTRPFIFESSDLVFFPHQGGDNQIKRCLEAYVGLGKTEIERIVSLPSRWVMVHKSAPMYVMYETGCYML